MTAKRILIIVLLFSAATITWPQEIREAVWAGKFYDENPGRLSAQLDGFFKKVPPQPSLPGPLYALIAPHAGYVYSGQTASFAYSLVKGKNFETVVIIGPSHQAGFDGCSIYLQGGFETPLGVVSVDENLARDISKASGFGYIPAAHETEHSVEVQVPFVQKALPGAKIVPIVMGYPSKKTIHALADALRDVLPSKKVLIVASTDMSHFLAKKEANSLDLKTASLIEGLQTDSLTQKIARGENIMCGGGPVISTLLSVQKMGTARAKILAYSDSSEAGGPESQVVGYLAAAVYTESPASEFALAPEEKKELLGLAKSAIRKFILDNSILDYNTQNPRFLSAKGAFVTLKKRGHLRGCIGFIEPQSPLYQTIIQAAIYAATKDQRFPAVSREELDRLEIEISVLSPLEKVQDPRLVRVGKHGLVIILGEKSGLLLPQVAVENGWTREEFLGQACLKAGLRENAWRQGAEMYTFEAIVFH